MARAKFEIKRKCEICGAWFYAKTIESKYYSKKCSEIASKRKKADAEKLSKFEEMVANIPDTRDYITVQEAVAMFAVGRNTIYRLIRNGTIPCVNLGERLIRIKSLIWKGCLANVNLCKKTPSSLFQSSTTWSQRIVIRLVKSLRNTMCMTVPFIYLHIRKYSIPIRQPRNYVYAPKEDIDNLYKSGKP